MQFCGFATEFIRCYLDDLLFFPIALSIIEFYHGCSIPLMHTLLGIVFISILFEIILPLCSDCYTADCIDVVFYFCGATIYHLSLKNNCYTV